MDVVSRKGLKLGIRSCDALRMYFHSVLRREFRAVPCFATLPPRYDAFEFWNILANYCLKVTSMYSSFNWSRVFIILQDTAISMSMILPRS